MLAFKLLPLLSKDEIVSLKSSICVLDMGPYPLPPYMHESRIKYLSKEDEDKNLRPGLDCYDLVE